MRLRPLGIDHLGLEQFEDGGGESGLLLLCQRPLVDARKDPRRFDTNRADRIAEQRRGRLNHGRRGCRRQRARRGGANERVWVDESRPDRGLGRGRGQGREQRQGARSGDGWLVLIGNQCIEQRLGVRGTDAASVKRDAKVGPSLPSIRKPFRDALRGPLGGSVGMALRAGVGRPDRRREIGPRDANAVIAPVVHPHVGFRGHVAIDALRTGAALRVMMMLRDIEFCRQMALRAEPIALRAERQTMRLMAIGAGDAGLIHAALDERTIFEHFAIDLPIGMIEAGLKQGRQIGIEERSACGWIP